MIWTTHVGPVISKKSYFVTRHPLQKVSTLNPFASLDIKLWINYGLIHAIIVLISLHIQINKIKGLNFKHLIHSIISPEESFRSDIFSFGLNLSCLVSFTFWTFSTLYGVQLQGVLVVQTFEPEVNSWEDIKFFDTQFVYVPEFSIVRLNDFLDCHLSHNLNNHSEDIWYMGGKIEFFKWPIKKLNFSKNEQANKKGKMTIFYSHPIVNMLLIQ